MAPRKVAEIVKALGSKGFEIEEGGRHIKCKLLVDGLPTRILTVFSRGSRGEYNDFMLGKVSRQLGLQRKEFDDLVDCPLDKPGYLTLLRERDKI